MWVAGFLLLRDRDGNIPGIFNDVPEFLKAGFPILLPFGDNRRYDMVVDVSGSFLRVQCKTASVHRGGAIIRSTLGARMSRPS